MIPIKKNPTSHTDAKYLSCLSILVHHSMITRSITQASSSSSGGDTATCCICLDKHRKQETFKPEDCNDVVCQACLATYLNTQLDIPQESYERIACPRQSCTGTFSAIAIVPLVLTSPNSAHYWWRKVIENTVMDSVVSTH